MDWAQPQEQCRSLQLPASVLVPVGQSPRGMLSCPISHDGFNAMDLMQLEMFVATAELRSVQRAAERVFRTQPAVSMAIRKLEEELGSPLFDRSNRGNYQLTAAGDVLFAHAKRLLGLRDEALTHVKELQSLEDGRVRIGANESTGHYLLPKLIQNFRKKHPKVRVDVTRQDRKSTRLNSSHRT